MLVNDVVSLGTWTFKQTFAICHNVTKVLREGLDVSGLIGLGFRSISSSDVEPLWQVISKAHLQQPLFSFALKRAADGETSEEMQDGGMATFGSVDRAVRRLVLLF